MEAEKILEDIEQKTKELKHEYDLFFSGEIHIEPQKLRVEIRRMIRVLNAQFLTNTGQKFRFHSLQATFNSYQRLWDRILLEIEMGTYQPHRFKADYHVGKLDKKTRQVIESEEHKRWMDMHHAKLKAVDDMKELYETYLSARKSTAEKGKVTYEAFTKSLKSQIPVLKEKLGGPVKFKVTIEDGKAKVKGVRE
jgi:hypothetical protein